MCDPVSITMAIATVASAVASAQAAKAQKKAAGIAQTAIREQLSRDQGALRQRQSQERVLAAQEADNAGKHTDVLKAAFSVSAQEGGVTGGSVNTLLDDLTRQESEFVSRRLTTLEGVEENIDRAAVSAGGAAFMALMQTTPTKTASQAYLQGAIGLGGAAANAYAVSQEE